MLRASFFLRPLRPLTNSAVALAPKKKGKGGGGKGGGKKVAVEPRKSIQVVINYTSSYTVIRLTFNFKFRMWRSWQHTAAA